MKHLAILFVICYFHLDDLHALTIHFEKSRLLPVNVSMSLEKLMGKEVLKLIKDSSVKDVDEPTFVKIQGLAFKNGIIEVKVLSRLLKDDPDFARGFIGIAFRINDSNTKYERFISVPLMQG